MRYYMSVICFIVQSNFMNWDSNTQFMKLPLILKQIII